MNSEKEINEKKYYIPKYKKYLYSIKKFEKYPEMSAEGVGRSIGYFIWIIFIFSLIISIGLLFKINKSIKNGIEYLDTNFSEINYSDGILSMNPSTVENGSSFGNMVINTGELTEEQIRKYEEDKSEKLQIIWLNNRVIAKVGNTKINYYYKDILGKFGLESFNKEEIKTFLLNKLLNPKTYAIYLLFILLYTFILYFITTLLDVLILSIFGTITAIISGIKLRYRAVFNMSIYAFTISISLQLIYIIINMFTDFEVKYFDLMYTTISYICLVAAIFMIKSDVIKQQLQLMKIIEIKKKEASENEANEKEDEDEEENEKEEEKKEEKQSDDEKDKENGELGTSAECKSINIEENISKDLNNRKEC